MNTRFSTYASYWIKQSIKRALINSAKTIRIPAYMVELLTKWRRATAKLVDLLGRTPTAEEIADELGIPKKKLRIVKKAITLYNATPQRDESEDGWSLGELIAEIGSCMLMADLHLPIASSIPQHAAYISGWLRGMSGDSHFIFTAAARASRAVPATSAAHAWTAEDRCRASPA